MFWAEFFGVVFDGSEDGVYGFVIDGVDMPFPLRLCCYEVAVEQRFEVV